jgi:hypothetical protein
MNHKFWLAGLLCLFGQNPSTASAFAFQSITSSVGSSTRRRQTSRATTVVHAFGLPDELPPRPENDKTSEKTLQSLAEKLDKSKSTPQKIKDNKAMQFLKTKGKVGGAANKNFVNAVGSDEGSTGRAPPEERNDGMGGRRKSRLAYQECTLSGVIDDISEAFPLTSSGTEWRGISDRVMGGRSDGFIKREIDLEGRPANVLTGHVSLANNGGFLQMVTDLSLDPVKNAVDASEYDGMELDILYRNSDSDGDYTTKDSKTTPKTFNVHLRTPGTFRQTSYRHTFEVEEGPNKWAKIMIPWSSFQGYGVAEPLDISALRRIGIVAIGEEMEVFLAVGGVRFYAVI